MTSFWLGAALLGGIAVAFLVVPLWLERRRAGQWSVSGLITAIVIVPIAVAVYLNVSTWQVQQTVQAPAEQLEMVEQLAAKMAQNPEDVQGWLLLARSYMALGQYALGRRAFEEVWARTPVADNDLKLALSEAMILSDRASIGGEAAVLVEEVLTTEPNNQKALWYGGLVAVERGRSDLACSRWSTLLASNTPQDVADVLRTQMASMSCTPVAGGSPAASSAAGGPTIKLAIRVAEGHSLEAMGPQAALFIFARAAAGGPPVAVIRESLSALPGEFTLSDQNTMVAGRSLADFPELSLVARVSASGQPLEQAGDLFAAAVYRQGDDETIEMVIDQIVP